MLRWTCLSIRTAACALAVALPAISGCASVSQVSTETASNSTAAGLASLKGAVETRAAGRYPGAVYGVTSKDRILELEAIGLADTEDGTPMTRDSIFRLMSMTKPVTAVAAMILVDEGRLELDRPVSSYLPEFSSFGVPGAPAVTLRHLLTHTSGIGFGAIPTVPKSLAQQVSETASRKMTVPAGSAWAYTGVDGTDIIARVVEVVSGEAYGDFVEQRIFAPLGMKDTGYTLDAAQQKRVVDLHAAANGEIRKAAALFPDFAYPSGGAGLYSTVPDYLRFVQMLLGKGQLEGVRVLSEASTRELHRPQLPAQLPGVPPGHNWGLLMRIVEEPDAARSPLTPGAYGWSGAYGTHFWVDPASGLAAVWMVNLTTAGGAGSPDALEFERLVMAACSNDRRCRR